MTRARKTSIPVLVLLGTCLISFVPSPAHAQACPGPPLAGAVAAVPPVTAIVANAWNLVEIPAFSPINAGGGFPAICAALGLPPDAQLLQIDASTGTVTSHLCGNAVAPPYTPCQGVAVFSPVGAGGVLPVGAAGVEGSWPYPVFGNGFGPTGDHLFGIPLTIVSTDPEVLCMDLVLPPGSDVIAFRPGGGGLFSHLCGTVPVWALIPGEAVLIRAPGPAGAVVGGGIVPIF